jgi:tRNA A37 methylthiotransferase MiaB
MLDRKDAYFGFQLVTLELLKQICLHFHFFSLLVALYSHELLLTITQVDEVSGELHLPLQLSADFVLELLEFQHVFLL